MRIPGSRECANCDTVWSYYETGSIGCPSCGSLRSRAVDDRELHTDDPTDFDLTAVREGIDADPLDTVATRARDAAREYRRRRGFVRGGRLLELDDQFLAAGELAHAADRITRSMRTDEFEELYFLELLEGADQGERPAETDIPRGLRSVRGLADAEAIDAYRRDVRVWAADRELPPMARSVLESLREHVKRVENLEGDVPLSTIESLREATRALGTGLREDDDITLTQARERLESIT